MSEESPDVGIRHGLRPGTWLSSAARFVGIPTGASVARIAHFTVCASADPSHSACSSFELDMAGAPASWRSGSGTGQARSARERVGIPCVQSR